jgi:16S rRNA (cytosine1402-N4)-methyltransferase
MLPASHRTTAVRGTIEGHTGPERQPTMSSSEPRAAVHVPVLLERVTDLLAPACSTEGAVLVDATLGLAGHSLAMLDAHPGLRLIGLDRDPDARAEAARRIEAAGHTDRATLVPAVFDELPEVLDRLGIDEVQGVLFDLGVSSLQLDTNERGFSYAADAPLDMRMDTAGPRTAADVVNTYSPKDLARVLRVYGEERFASRIASAIDRERAREPFTTTARLAELVREAIPAATRRTGGHPAKRTFQALRIEVNDELGVLERALPAAIEALAVGGRVVVITFHSLEDRIVKQTLAAGATDRTPPDMPVPMPELGPVLRLLTRGGESASVDEVAVNPRSASARVRAAERIRRAA